MYGILFQNKGDCMIKVLNDLIQSNKFWMTIFGSAVVAGLSYAGAPHELTMSVAGLFGINITAQGMADFKKNQPR